MPTPGPWEGPVQRTGVPGSIFNGGWFRWGRVDADEYYPGAKTAAELNGLVNGRRLATNGGTEGTQSASGHPLDSKAFVRAFYQLDIDGTFLDVGDAFDQGWWLGCNITAGWADYITFVQTEQFTAGAAGYEIEDGPSIHIVSVDGAQVTIPMELTAADYPAVSMETDITTAPGVDYTTVGAEYVWEHRVLATGYTVGSSGGTTSEDPINLSLDPGQFDATNGGFHLYSRSTQGAIAWDTGGYAGRDQVQPQIWFHSASGGTYEITYDVTFPRYRLLYDGTVVEPAAAVESVTRQFPRDDALGSMGSASRLVPAPRGGRVVGGYN